MSRQEIMGASAVERAPVYARSVARRATATLGLIIGFYVLTVALIIGLFIGTFALILFFSVGGLIPAVFTLTTAVVLLAAVLPKHKRFKAPGPRITATEQPKLFQAIAEVAKQAEQQVPEEVYLIPQVNAWVSTWRKRSTGTPFSLVNPLSVSSWARVWSWVNCCNMPFRNK